MSSSSVGDAMFAHARVMRSCRAPFACRAPSAVASVFGRPGDVSELNRRSQKECLFWFCDARDHPYSQVTLSAVSSRSSTCATPSGMLLLIQCVDSLPRRSRSGYDMIQLLPPSMYSSSFTKVRASKLCHFRYIQFRSVSPHSL